MGDTNQQVIERLYEDVWNGKNPNAAEELVHDAYVIHDRELAEELKGPDLYHALASSTRELFSDLTFSIGPRGRSSLRIGRRTTIHGHPRTSNRGPHPSSSSINRCPSNEVSGSQTRLV